jgi:macrolide-specific efflux system membrane fusion protein
LCVIDLLRTLPAGTLLSEAEASRRALRFSGGGVGKSRMKEITTMETMNSSPVATSAETANDAPATPPRDRHVKARAFLQRRNLWLIGALLVAGAGVFGYFWAFGTAKVVYATAAVERGDVESTVVAAGIVQPVKYVDVGAQTSGKLKSLKVIRGDQVKENQLLAEIDPALADTALTGANATLENMTSQRVVKQAQLVLAKVQRDRTTTFLRN